LDGHDTSLKYEYLFVHSPYSFWDFQLGKEVVLSREKNKIGVRTSCPTNCFKPVLRRFGALNLQAAKSVSWLGVRDNKNNLIWIGEE
jgi:hypothetical protein